MFGSVPGQVDSAAEEYLRIYRTIDKLVVLTRSTINDPTALSELNKLQKTLTGCDNDDPAQIFYYYIGLIVFYISD